MKTACLLSLLIWGAPLAVAQFTQQAGPLRGNDYVGPSGQGYSGALSADGNTALVGGPFDNYPTGGGFTGAAWVYTRSNGVWSQQGPKLVGTHGLLAAQGWSVALSADGNTALLGGPRDGIDGHVGNGAFWVFTRSNGVWSQQGGKLVPSDVSPGASPTSGVGQSVALSADGNTALVGGPGDNNSTGAAWVFTRSGGVWSQQGAKLAGTGAAGPASQGDSVAISADGNTALIGGPLDNTNAQSGYATGATWVFTRSGGVWSQQGAKLVGTGASGGANQGFSVTLSADGNTAVAGGPSDTLVMELVGPTCNSGYAFLPLNFFWFVANGAAWVFTRSNGVWSQQGNKLAGTGGGFPSSQGTSVSLSADGNLLLVGGSQDGPSNEGCPGNGATWVFARRNGAWSQQGSKLVEANFNEGQGPYQQVEGLSADGGTALIGGFGDVLNDYATGFETMTGAAWVFTQPAASHFAVSAPAAAAAGVSFPFTVTAQDANNNTVSGYLGTVHFTSDDGAAVLPAATTLINGTGMFFATLATSGNQTITATDAAVATTTGTSGVIAVSSSAHFAVSAPASAMGGTPFNFTVTALDSSNHTQTGYSGTVHFTSSDPRATLPANATLVNGIATFSAALRTGGNQTITATDTASAAVSGTSAFIAVTALTPPSPVSVTPAAGSASNSTYTFVFTDPRGYQDLSVVDILVNDFLDGRHACYLAYAVAQNTLYLVDDAGDAGGPFAGLQNSQCAVTLVSANGSGNNLNLVLSIAWSASFAGDQIIFMAARDVQQDNSGLAAAGSRARAGRHSNHGHRGGGDEPQPGNRARPHCIHFQLVQYHGRCGSGNPEHSHQQ